MFRRLREPTREVTLSFEGRTLRAAAGESVAAALLAAGVTEFRLSPVRREPRAPYCMIGNCFECLVEIDGQPDCQACLVRVADGMAVRRQMGEGEA